MNCTIRRFDRVLRSLRSVPVRRLSIAPPRVSVDLQVQQRSPVEFGLILNGKSIKTPSGVPLVAPSEAIAQLVSIEWNTSVLGKDFPHARPIVRYSPY